MSALRPAECCGKCPPIAGGGYDCTCKGNPRCPKTKSHTERGQVTGDDTCTARFGDFDVYGCDLPPGHEGLHHDRYGLLWTIGAPLNGLL